MVNTSKEALFQDLASNKIASHLLVQMAKIPRENFIDPSQKEDAYRNTPLCIDCMQTISQPYIVARMTTLLLEKISPTRILEIGTGSGYQAAVLSLLAKQIYTLERFEKLYRKSSQNLIDYPNVYCFHKDGFDGLVEHSPYDGIIITASVEKLSFALIQQMNNTSIIVYPEKTSSFERLTTLYKVNETFTKTYYEDVRFVPMLPELA
jgi:protein-L-isoaspartate(D-aspartate) O-methyltransferase